MSELFRYFKIINVLIIFLFDLKKTFHRLYIGSVYLFVQQFITTFKLYLFKKRISLSVNSLFSRAPIKFSNQLFFILFSVFLPGKRYFPPAESGSTAAGSVSATNAAPAVHQSYGSAFFKMCIQKCSDVDPDPVGSAFIWVLRSGGIK